MSLKIYVYPIVPLRLSISKNPYINDLIYSLENVGNEVVNKSDERHNGVFSIFHYFLRSDAFYFNWIEYLTRKKYGYLQLLVFLFQFFLIKLFNKKIIWTLHNLSSHHTDDRIYKFIQGLMLYSSDIIVIHTKESFSFLEKKGINKRKVLYFFHPFNKNFSLDSNISQAEKKYDILIWGLMSPYKGVYEFLDYINSVGDNCKILLAGKFTDNIYFNKVAKVVTRNTEIINSYVDDKELLDLHSQSKFILFPYIGNSILNSGSLILSLSYNAKIIGPNRGAFKELGDLGIISNFDSYSDILKHLNKDFETPKANDLREKFILNHSWDCFCLELNKMLVKQ